MPRGNNPRWFIGTRWEQYIVVFLIMGLTIGLGLVVASILQLSL